jgi:multidrug efflux system membrane fusion protein
VVNRGNTGTPLRPPILKQVPPPEAPPEKKRGRWLWWLAFLLLAAAGLPYYRGTTEKRQAAASTQEKREAAQPASVTAARVTMGNLPIYLRGLGTVTAFNTVNVKPRVDGPIVKVNFQEGQNVATGEVLVQIDPRPYQVALEQAQGQQARDEAQFRDAQVNLAAIKRSGSRASSRGNSSTPRPPRWDSFKARWLPIRPPSTTPNSSSASPM